MPNNNPVSLYFTDNDYTLIRFYLGYPSVYFYANPRLESAMEVVGNDLPTSNLVHDILNTLTGSIKQSLLDTLDEIGIAKVDSGSVGNGGVEYFAKMERFKGLRANGMMYCAQLSDIFGVPLETNPFGTRGYQGDRWKGGAGNSNGFGFNLGYK